MQDSVIACWLLTLQKHTNNDTNASQDVVYTKTFPRSSILYYVTLGHTLGKLHLVLDLPVTDTLSGAQGATPWVLLLALSWGVGGGISITLYKTSGQTTEPE